MSEEDTLWAQKNLGAFLGTAGGPAEAGYWRHYTPTESAQLQQQQYAIERILDHYTPNWRQENPPSGSDPWDHLRAAANRCRGAIYQKAEVDEKLGPSRAPALRADEFHEWVWDAARAHWESGNRREAIDAAARNVNSRLKRKLDRRDLSEWKQDEPSQLVVRGRIREDGRVRHHPAAPPRPAAPS